MWGDVDTGQPGHAFIAGGYVQVDSAMVPGGAVGRLVEYTAGPTTTAGTGTFVTRCTTDRVLWWVTGAGDGSGTVFAVGEGGRVLRYRSGQCDTLTFDLVYPQGVPTFWGGYASSATDLWLVGGTAAPLGPRGVLVHWDGTRFHQETTVPMAAQLDNLYKIDRNGDGHLVVVGTRGRLLDSGPIGPTGGTDLPWSVVPLTLRPSDTTLFTVSCGRFNSPTCYAVGGIGVGLLIRSETTGSWAPVSTLGDAGLDDLPGLNGVFVQDQANIFIVGTRGFTMHTNGLVQYRATPPTTATLHGVGGTFGYVLAVGGELDVPNATQRGVILVRGDTSPTFTFDGMSYTASGSLRTSLGGSGQ